MISVIRDGSIVAQHEIVLPEERGFLHLEPGPYDVRVESEGAVTEMKRGVQVILDRQLDLHFALHAGQGLHTVEYATGGLSREEVAARLQRLETAVADLRAAQARHN